MGLFGRNYMPVEGRTVLLTGGSEGTGLTAARILAGKGANIVIVARDRAKLDSALRSIKEAAKSPETQRFHAISADVAKPRYADGVVAEATEWNGGQPPEIVWCLAGLSTPMLWMDEGTLEAARYSMDVNYFGSAEMSQSLMRAWLLPRQGVQKSGTKAHPPLAKHIIFTGSVLSTFSMAGHTTYGPAKTALRALADALVMEVLLYPEVPIEVHLVLPNSILTASYERENKTKPEITAQLEGAETPQTKEEVAELAISGLEKGHYFITTSFQGEMLRWCAMSNSPRNNWFVDTVMGWFVPLIMFFVMWDMNRQVSSWGRKSNNLQKTK